MLTARPYQQTGIDFLRSRQKALLYDQPGLGKTVTSLLAAESPLLVSAPSYWLEHWYNIIYEHISQDVTIVQGTRVQREQALNRHSQYTIVNHDMFRTYDLPPSRTLIVDESHHFRGKNAIRTQKIFTYAARTPYVFLLTATPIYREADDLWAQLHLIDPRAFSSYWRFVDEFCVKSQTPFGIKIIGTRNRPQLTNILRTYGLGRTYEEVGLELPPTVESTIKVDFPLDLRRTYDTLKRNYRLQLPSQEQDIPLDSASEVLATLRRLTVCSDKLNALRDLLHSITESSPNTVPLIYCWYRETVHTVATYINGTPITGDTPPNERANLAKSSTRPIVATLASMSEGIDLSFVRYIIFFEEDYTPGLMYQALSRVRRLRPQQVTITPTPQLFDTTSSYTEGNPVTVITAPQSTSTETTIDHEPSTIFVYYIHMKSTVDDAIHTVIGRRQTSIKQVVQEALK